MLRNLPALHYLLCCFCLPATCLSPSSPTLSCFINSACLSQSVVLIKAEMNASICGKLCWLISLADACSMEVNLQKNYKYVNHPFVSFTCVWYYIYYSFQLNTFSPYCTTWSNCHEEQLCVIMLHEQRSKERGKVGNSRLKYVSVCWPLVGHTNVWYPCWWLCYPFSTRAVPRPVLNLRTFLSFWTDHKLPPGQENGFHSGTTSALV